VREIGDEGQHVSRNYPWISVTTIGDMLDRSAEEKPKHEAVVYPDIRYTYKQLAEEAAQYSRGLLYLGVQPGDRVGYFMHENASMSPILFAVAKIGAVLVPVNGRFKIHELKQVVVNSGIQVLFTSRSKDGTDYAGLLSSCFPELAKANASELSLADAPELKAIVYLGGGEVEAGMLREAQFHDGAELITTERVEARQQAVRVRDTAMLVNTSGTTAAPKGAMITHESFSRTVQEVIADRLEVTGNSKVWTMLPLSHMGGLAFMVGSVCAGATFVHPGYFDPAVSLEQLRQESCTHAIPGFDQFWKQIVMHADCRQDHFDSLELVLAVGVEESLRQLQEQTPHAPLVTNTGMTETGFIAVSSPRDTLELRMTAGGLPFRGVECEIHDPDTGELLPWGGVGELWFRGPCQFEGYFRDPETNIEVFDKRGFFKTGDLVRIRKDGRINFVSRLKDMLKVGGENVAAAEVEGFLLTHPAVFLAQVVAAPDEQYGEVPAAYIQLKPSTTSTEAEIIEFCVGQIAKFRVPRYVRFVDEWPMSGTKIKKYVLRTKIAEELLAT